VYEKRNGLKYSVLRKQHALSLVLKRSGVAFKHTEVLWIRLILSAGFNPIHLTKEELSVLN
jgi:hypothetical protein